VLAIVALCAAIVAAASAALDVTGAWAVTAGALSLAALALVRIARADVPLAGRWMAVAGLILSVASLATVISHAVARRAWARAEAPAVAEQFIELLRSGQRRAAHQLTLTLVERCPPGESLEACYSEKPGRRELFDRFLDDPPIRRILKTRATATVTLERVEMQEFQRAWDVVGLVYRAQPPEDAADDPFFIWILVERRCDQRTSQAFWQIKSCQIRRSAQADQS
jgi:hypothetical protein